MALEVLCLDIKSTRGALFTLNIKWTGSGITLDRNKFLGMSVKGFFFVKLNGKSSLTTEGSEHQRSPLSAYWLWMKYGSACARHPLPAMMKCQSKYTFLKLLLLGDFVTETRKVLIQKSKGKENWKRTSKNSKESGRLTHTSNSNPGGRGRKTVSLRLSWDT